MRANPVLWLVVLLPLLAPGAPAGELSSEEFQRATAELEKALAARDAAAFGRAVETLARDDSARAVEIILAALEKGSDLDVYQAVRGSLGSVGSAEARGAIARQARSSKNWRVQYACLDVAGRRGDEEGREIVFGAFDEGRRDLALLAYRLCGELRWTEAVDPLIEALARFERRKDEERQGEIHGALSAITDRQFPTAELWKAWWDKNREGFRPGAGEGAEEGVLSRIKRRRFDDYRYITEIGEGEVVVVKGVFDHVETVLEHLEIPHRVIERAEFEGMPLDPRQILVFNCHETDFVFRDEEIERVRRFVGAGGYLFTSDWDLQNVTARAFPKHVAAGAPTEEHKVKIQMGPGADQHPLMKDVFGLNPYEHASMTWQIDGVSFLIDVRDARAVQALVVSDELEKIYRNRFVAVTFQVRDNAYAPPGRVLHVLSHFDKQKDEKDDGYALQQLLLNFFIEKKKTWAKIPKAGNR